MNDYIMVISFIFLFTFFNTFLIFAIFQCYASKTRLCHEFRLIGNTYNRQNFSLLLVSFKFFIYGDMFIHVNAYMCKHVYVTWRLCRNQKQAC